jgi:hypothetical protein
LHIFYFSSYSSSALWPFEFVLGIPQDSYPFCFVQSSCSLRFYTHIHQFQLNILCTVQLVSTLKIVCALPYINAWISELDFHPVCVL